VPRTASLAHRQCTSPQLVLWMRPLENTGIEAQ
jgi:hypothetical protein